MSSKTECVGCASYTSVIADAFDSGQPNTYTSLVALAEEIGA